MATGFGVEEGINGGPECGKGHPMPVLIGLILTTITTSRAGPTTRVIGAMMTMVTTTTGDIAKMRLSNRGPAKKLGPC